MSNYVIMCTYLICVNLYFLLRLEVMVQTITRSVTDHKLKSIAKEMPKIVLASRAKNTIDKYTCYFKQWEKWCEQFPEVKAIPANEYHVAIFMCSLIQNEQSAAVVESIFYAIKHFHKINLVNDPFETSLGECIVDAAKRTCTKRIQKKEPISVKHLKQVYERVGKEACSLLDLRTFTMMVLSFVGFLRYSEAAFLRRSDFVFKETYVKVFIEKSKTDIYREGNWLFISKVDSEICPISILKLYLNKCGIDPKSEEFIFRGMSFFKSKSVHKLRSKNVPISYSTARTNMLSLLSKIGVDEKLFGLHSLRAGGATEAANNGVKDRLFKRHGRWKSDKAKDGYVKDNLKELLSVSLNLGL